MAQYALPSGASVILWQNLTAVAGRPLTFSMLVRGETPEARGWITPYFAGGGIGMIENSARAHLRADGGAGGPPPPSVNDGWHIASITIVPVSSGPIQIGVKLGPAADNLQSTTNYFLDEACVSYGVETPLNPTRFGSLELGGRTFVSATVPPATGTWQPGDVVWNAAPATGAPAGWICTAPGTPGTWSAFGRIE
jgi:hypothetical protein